MVGIHSDVMAFLWQLLWSIFPRGQCRIVVWCSALLCVVHMQRSVMWCGAVYCVGWCVVQCSV